MNLRFRLAFIVLCICCSARCFAQIPDVVVCGYPFNQKRVVNVDCDTCITYEFDIKVKETANGEAYKDNLLSLPHIGDTLHSLQFIARRIWDSLWIYNNLYISLTRDSTVPDGWKTTSCSQYSYNYFQCFNCDTIYIHRTSDRNKSYWEVTNDDDGWEISKQYDTAGALLFIHKEKLKNFDLWKTRACRYKNGKKTYISRSRVRFRRKGNINRDVKVTWEFKDEGHFHLKRYVSIYEH